MGLEPSPVPSTPSASSTASLPSVPWHRLLNCSICPYCYFCTFCLFRPYCHSTERSFGIVGSKQFLSNISNKKCNILSVCSIISSALPGCAMGSSRSSVCKINTFYPICPSATSAPSMLSAPSDQYCKLLHWHLLPKALCRIICSICTFQP